MSTASTWLAVAMFEQKLYTLPQLGRFSRENTLVGPHPTPETVIIDDDPSSDYGFRSSDALPLRGSNGTELCSCTMTHLPSSFW
jgi:hypothetical protein